VRVRTRHVSLRDVGIDPGHCHRIRRAGLNDAPAIADLFLASRHAAMPWLPVLHGRESTVAFFQHVVLARADVWIEVTADGALRGFIAFDGRELEHLYVAPGHQRRGTGARLLSLAQARGGPLELWTFQRNAHAQAFYLRHGFQPVRETDGSHNEEREPDVRFRWEPPAG
jgi:GNAT superfamily N-acetyltransferase